MIPRCCFSMNRVPDSIRRRASCCGRSFANTTRRARRRLAIIDHGKVIALGTPSSLKASIPGGYLLRLRFGNQTSDLLQRLQSLAGVREVRSNDGSGADVYADRGGSLIPEIAALALSPGAGLSDVNISQPSLENLFLHHTGRSLRD